MYLFADAERLPWMIAAGGAILGIWFILRRSLKRSMTPRENVFLRKEKPANAESARGMMEASDDLARWEVAMHETARDLKAELDSKMAALQALTKAAQFEADRLEAAVHRAERLGISTTRDSLAELENVADVRELQTIATKLAEARPVTPLFPPQLCQRIYSQSDLGRSPAAIAASVGIPIGDVELLLSVRLA